MKDVRRRRFDIVHAYGWYTSVFAIPASRLAMRPVIIASVRDAGAYMTPAKIQALKFMCRLSNCVLANSQAGRNWLVSQGVHADKIQVIGNGIKVPVEVSRLADGPIRREFGIPAGASICACIGRVVSSKGIDDCLRTARVLLERGRDVRFLVIGSSAANRNYQSELDALARQLNIAHRVVFTGNRQDTAAILREVDIVVHPSLSEGLSNVILEAMSAQVPVVATRVGGNPELVDEGRTGFLVPIQSPEETATAICRLLDRPEMMRAFGERARQRVIEEFSIERMLSRTESLYLRLIEHRVALPGANQLHFSDHEGDPFIN